MESTDGSNPVFKVGDRVIICSGHEGYNGQTGTVRAVFRSGRCAVNVLPAGFLNLSPEEIKHAVSD